MNRRGRVFSTPHYHPAHWQETNKVGGYFRDDGALAPSLTVGMQEVVGLRED